MDQLSAKPFAVIRILFGLIWLVDAALKWNPAFLNNFTSYLTDAVQGQPIIISAWINFWVKIIGPNAHIFAIAIAVFETAIALALIFGLFTRTTIVAGIILSLLIWTTAEGFGGPYAPGSTDIGTAVIYIPLFFALWFGKSWLYFSLDTKFFNN